MMIPRAQAEVALRQCFGPSATFREGQWEAIETIAVRRERAFVVQKTGWGKSLVYFIATRLLRDTGSGPTLIVSPLLALMRDQERMAQRLGIRAATLNSANTAEWPEIEAALRRDEIDVLLVSPERLGNAQFVNQTMPAIVLGVGLLVIDEAHCISDWGHDFRPDYRRIVGIVRQLPTGVPVLATTATANDRVINDVQAQLGQQVSVLRGPLSRESLRLQTILLDTHAERLAWLAQHIPHLRRAGIVYVQTVFDAMQVSDWLTLRGLDARAYYGRLGDMVRREIEQHLHDNRLDVVVATTALGMGFDKPDLGFVIHYQRPGSIVAYYQQVGRAGRAIPEAHVVLLHGQGDDDIQDYFIDTAFPSEATFTQTLAALEDVESASVHELGRKINASYSRLTQALKMLELDGAVIHEGSRYSRTINPWQPDRTRILGVTNQRRREFERMHQYAVTDACQMQFIATELDDLGARRCGRCANCTGYGLSQDVDQILVAQARLFLQSAEHRIKPKTRLPVGVYPDRSRTLDAAERVTEGRALSIWGDTVWSNLVQAGKYESGHFDDALVGAAARLIRERWKPSPAPSWVTAVPSLRRPELVPDFATRLAKALDLPYFAAIGRRHDSPEQKMMQNSAQQLLNVADNVAVRRDQVQPGPVLLVDDIVDSGWTFAVCGARLLRAGAEIVYPFALALTPAGKDAQ